MPTGKNHCRWVRFFGSRKYLDSRSFMHSNVIATLLPIIIISYKKTGHPRLLAKTRRKYTLIIAKFYSGNAPSI